MLNVLYILLNENAAIASLYIIFVNIAIIYVYRTLLLLSLYEPRHENRIFAYAKTKTQISCAVTTQLIGTFVFAVHR